MRAIEILLVEDNPSDVLLTQHAFKQSKLVNNINVAENGEEAMNYLFKKNGHENAPKPDLIMLDLNLPKVSGHEVLEAVKNTEELKRIPVVVMSGSQAQKDVAKSYDLHANCYIVKPMDITKLMEIANSIDHFWFSMVSLPPKD